jgi:polysaccharide export outer membrane protein
MAMANSKNSRRGDGVKMTSGTKRRSYEWSLVRCSCVLLCTFLSHFLLAQAGSTSNTTDQPPASSTAAPAPEQGTSAHHTQGDNIYVIGNDDLLNVNVWKEPDISRSVPVRSDGNISLPLVGEVLAAGRTPHQLEAEIASKLKNYISEPEVTVIVQESKSQKFNILGMVTKPGEYPLTNSMTVLDAIALAGGFRDFAKQKSIYVLRENADGTKSHLDFNYKDVVKGKNSAQNVRLQPRDTIVIP